VSFLRRSTTQLWEAWNPTVDNWLLHNSHLCALAFLIGALVLLSLGVRESRLLSSIFAHLVSERTEPIPHKFAGLDSLVLSRFQASTILPKDKDWPPEVNTALNNIDTELENPPIDLSKKKFRTSAPDLSSIQETSVTATEADSFLFIPGIIIQHGLKLDQFKKPISGNSKYFTPQLEQDVKASFAIAPSLKELLDASTSGNQDAPAFIQVYFLTSTGVLTIYDKGGSGENSFSPHRFFPERSYFWPTIASSGKKPEPPCIEPFTFCTLPYIDLAGHGIVVTMCKPVFAAQISDAVICGDVSDSTEDIKQTVKSEVGPFETRDPIEITCPLDPKLGDCGPSPGQKDSSLSPDLLRTLDQLMSRSEEEVKGSIYEFPANTTPLSPSFLDKSIGLIGLLPWVGPSLKSLFLQVQELPINFTVPIEVVPEKRELILLFCSVDFSSPATNLLLEAIGAALCTVGLLISLFYSFQSQKKAREFIRSLQNVMAISPVPFVHLSEQTCIIGSNRAFQDLVKMTPEELAGSPFYSLLDPSSKARYQEVAKCRKKKLLTKPYELTIKDAKGTPIKVVVSGSALDLPRTSHPNITAPVSTFLHTFGIIVPSATISDDVASANDVLRDTLPLPDFTALLVLEEHGN
jgi:PAS domain-containing protein